MTASPVSWLRERAVEFERLGAPLYAVLVRRIARDWETGGPVRDVLAGWEEAPSEAVVDLRLLGGLFRIVLRGRAPALAPFYRSLVGRAGPEGAWDVAREVVAAHVAELRGALDVVPQTNEVGRAAPLVVGCSMPCLVRICAASACSRSGRAPDSTSGPIGSGSGARSGRSGPPTLPYAWTGPSGDPYGRWSSRWSRVGVATCTRSTPAPRRAACG